MRLILIISCLFLLIGRIQAQQMFSDSILALPVADTTKLRKLSSWIRANGPNLREPVMKAAQAALELAQKTGDPSLLSDAWFDMGNTCMFQEKVEDSGAAFQESLNLARKMADMERTFRALLGMTRYYGSKGDYVRTLAIMQEAEILIPQVKNAKLVGGCYTLFCNVFEQMRRWDEVEKIARRAIQFNLHNNVISQIPASYYHLGRCFENNGQLDSAVWYLRKAQTGYRLANNQEELAGMTMQIAQLLHQLHEPEAAVQEMETALHIVEQNRDSAGIAFVNLEKGKLMMALARMQEAEPALLKSAAIFEKFGLSPPLQDVYHSLSNFYAQTNAYRNAYLYFQKYTVIRDSLEGIDKQKQLDEMSAKFENTKKEQQITLLNQENHNQRLQIGLLLALAALLMAGAVAGFQFVRNRQRKTLLNEQNHWMKIVVDSTENERRRIAADLHDGIAQQIAAVKMYAGGLVRTLEGNQRAQAEKLAAELDNTSREVRQLSHQMMPRTLGELGLVAALEDLFWLSFSQSSIKTVTDTEQYTLPTNPTTDTALYRIAQEAVNNIMKHAQPTSVSLCLRNTGNLIYLTITDDGLGFDVKAGNTSLKTLGMENIQSRVRLCGGTVHVHSSPGKGVKIDVEMPYSGQ